MDKRIEADDFNELVRQRDAHTNPHRRYALTDLIAWWAPVPYTVGGAVRAARGHTD